MILPLYSYNFGKCLEKLGYKYSPNTIPTDSRLPQTQNIPGLSINEVNRILDESYRQIGVPHLGLLLGDQLGLNAHGMAGVSAMAQPTYAECLKSAERFCERSFPPLSMKYFETNGTIGLRMMESLSLSPHSRFFVESITVNFYNILQFLLGEETEPAYIAFAYPEPEYAELYKEYFNCRIRFNALHHEFVIDKQIAQRKLLLANRQIATSAEQQFFSSIPVFKIRYLQKRLREIVICRLEEDFSLQAVAAELGVSGRTLRRQLYSLGTSFSIEVDRIRLELAIKYMTETGKSITEISLVLGFCDASAFSQAFKKWTGKSPRQFRVECTNDLGPLL